MTFAGNRKSEPLASSKPGNDCEHFVTLPVHDREGAIPGKNWSFNLLCCQLEPADEKSILDPILVDDRADGLDVGERDACL